MTHIKKEMMNEYHETVLVNEVLEGLHIENPASRQGGQARYIDCTLGNGGHSLEILKAGGKVMGIEMDPQMLEIADKRLKDSGYKDYKLVQGNFKNIDRIARENDLTDVSGILMDLGVTNIHLKSLERGFSFENPEALLDMRLNPEEQGVKASDLLNALREDQLEDLFKVALEPGAARWITSRVISAREEKPISTVRDLLEISKRLKTGKSLNEATLPFLALRIAVNGELDNLREGLPKAFELLKSGGRLVIISFHSGEDEIVKDFFNEKKNEGKAKIITFKPVLAGLEELEINRRARSAKLRVIEKV